MSDAWIGLVGVLLGVGLGFVGSYVSERSRRRHEDAHRFDDERRAVYIRLIEASTEIEDRIAARHSALTFRRDYPALVEQAEALRHERPDLASMTDVPGRADYTTLDLAMAEIELLARFNVEMRATFFKFALQGLDAANDMVRQDDAEKADAAWSEGSSTLRQARQDFLRSAKADLNLPTGVMTKRQERIWRLKQRVGLAPRSKPKMEPATPLEAPVNGASDPPA